MQEYPEEALISVKQVADLVNPERYQDILESMIRIPSLSGEEAELARWMADHLREVGVETVEVDRGNNVVAHFGTGPRRLLISAHTDTMQPHLDMSDPYNPRAEGQEGSRKVYGLGAASTKACLASILEAITILSSMDVPLPTTTFLGVACDLHPTRHGIKEAFQLHDFKAEAVLVGEPTDLRIGLGARGYTHIDVTFKGKPHHAGRPDQSKNPVAGAAAFLETVLSQPLPEHPLLGSATVTPIECDSEGQR
ncbi:MAG: M20 family metallopeptidase, partial [Anaerolineales bacterium]